MEVVGRDVLKPSLRVTGVVGETGPLVSSLACLLKVVATLPVLPFPCQQIFLEQNRDRPA